MKMISIRGALVDFPEITIVIHGYPVQYIGNIINFHGNFLGINNIFLIIFIRGLSYNIQMVCTIMDPRILCNKIFSYNPFGMIRFKHTTLLITSNCSIVCLH